NKIGTKVAFCSKNNRFCAYEEPSMPTSSPDLSPGDTAWMLISAALVMLMVPRLPLFYGGMVRRKNILGTMMHSMAALAIIGVEWILLGYAMTFGTDHAGVIGF